MGPWKVVIADGAEEFRLALSEHLQPQFRVRCCADGDEALDQVARWQPDVLVMDLILPGLDGVGLLQAVAQLPNRPRVLIVSAMHSDFVGFNLEELGVEYVMLKPCRVRNVAARVGQLTSRLAPAPHLRTRYRYAATDTLMELGLPNGRQGFQHLQAGLPMLMRQRDQRLSKELYDSIARDSGCTALSVEKAIRKAIEAGWENGDPAAWGKYFPGSEKPPTNGEFLFRLADILLQQLGSEPGGKW